MTVNGAIEIIKKREEEIAKLSCAMKDTCEPNDEVVIPRYMGLLLYGYLKEEVEDWKNRRVEDRE